MNKRSADDQEDENMRTTKKRRSDLVHPPSPSNGHRKSNGHFSDEGPANAKRIGQVEEEWRVLEEEAKSVVLLPHNPNDRFADVWSSFSLLTAQVVPVRDTLCKLSCGTYINANSIGGAVLFSPLGINLEGLSFIATQEPLRIPDTKSLGFAETESHFWSLVWSEVGLPLNYTNTITEGRNYP